MSPGSPTPAAAAHRPAPGRWLALAVLSLAAAVGALALTALQEPGWRIAGACGLLLAAGAAAGAHLRARVQELSARERELAAAADRQRAAPAEASPGDAAERSRAEEAARFHALLLDQLQEAVVACDAELRITAWSRGAERMFGHAAADAIGRPGRELLRPEAISPGEDELRETLLRGSAAAFRRVYHRRDGAPVHVEGSGVLLRGPAGEITGYLTTLRDVTEQQRLQARLAASERLASVGTLAAGVAHEINNPLAYLVANLAHAGAALAERGDDELAAALREGEEGARRIAAIVRALRTFSRDSGGAPALRRALDPRQPAAAAAQMADPQLRSRARFVLDLREVPPVVAEEHELAQVVLNLLVNAAQAIPEGSPDLHEVVLRVAPDRGGVAIVVRDTGSGIAAEHLPRVFDPFFTTKPVGVGTGLGLAICHGIVTSLGGTLEVESEAGKGTRFTVRLPAAPPQEPAAPAETPPPAASGVRGRILVLDDEPLVCRSVARCLAAHDVYATTDPHEALAHVLAGDPFDVILCDLMMPGLSGMQCHAEVCRMRPELAGRMVFLTGGAFTDDARAFLAAVPNRRLEKSFEPEALRALVREQLALVSGAAPAS